MKSLVLITIFGLGLCLGMFPSLANLFVSQVLCWSQELWLKFKTISAQAVKTTEMSSEQLVQTGSRACEKVMELTQQVIQISKDYGKVVSEFSFRKSNCQCRSYTCGCRYNLVNEHISFDKTVCLNITYLVDKHKVKLTFKLDEKVLIGRKISVKNPPPLCADIPYVYNLASLCLRFYNLKYADHGFTGCAAFDLKGMLGKTFDLGCLKIPPAIK